MLMRPAREFMLEAGSLPGVRHVRVQSDRDGAPRHLTGKSECVASNHPGREDVQSRGLCFAKDPVLPLAGGENCGQYAGVDLVLSVVEKRYWRALDQNRKQ